MRQTEGIWSSSSARRAKSAAIAFLLATGLISGAGSAGQTIRASQDGLLAGTDVCAELSPEPRLTADTIWDASGSPYHIDCMLSAGDATLTIEPGTELRFGKRAGLIFDSTAALEIQGEAPGDVRLMSDAASPAPGDWIGLVFQDANADLRGFTLSHATIGLHAPMGGSGLGASITIGQAVIRDSAADGLRVRDLELDVVDTELRGNAGFGLHMSGLTVARLLGNRFVENGQAGYYDGNGPLGGLETSGNLSVGNGRDTIWIAGLASTDARAPSWGVDLAREVRGELRVPPNVELSIEPGARVELDRGSRIRVDGHLSAEGVALSSDRRWATADQAWEGIHFGPRGEGQLMRSVLMRGGAGRGAVLLSGAVDSLEGGLARRIGGNRFLQLVDLGLRLEAAAPHRVDDNLFRDLGGQAGSTVAAIRVGGGPQPVEAHALSLAHNHFGSMTTAVEVEGPLDLELPFSSFDQVGGQAIINTELGSCVRAPASWWGSWDGPDDASIDQDDPCGPGLGNRNDQGVKVSDGVDYSGWSPQRPLPLPRLTGPACGLTHRARMTVAGSVENPDGRDFDLVVYDGETVLGEGRVDAEGRFAVSTTLGAGTHLLAARSLSSKAGSSELPSPFSSWRRIEVDPSLPLDPLGTRFVYGSSDSQIAQPLRDASGCAAGCAGAGGFVELPPDLPVRLEVPMAGRPITVELQLQAGEPIPLAPESGEVWSTAPFIPTEGRFTIRVVSEASGASPFDCPGYIHLSETGRVFLDIGAPGEPLLDQGFENGLAEGWIASRGWQVTDEDAHDSNYAITDSPYGSYGPGGELTLSQILPIDISGLSAPELSFWHHYRLAGGDRAWVEARSGGAGRWRHLTDFEGTVGGWRAERIALDDYAGGSVQIRFRLVTDANPVTVDDGWFLDDIRIGPGGAFDGRFQAGETPLARAEVTLLQQSPETGRWLDWESRGQINPQLTDEAGRYGFYGLPPGIYRARVSDLAHGEQLLASAQVADGRYAEPLALRKGGHRIYLPFASRPARSNPLLGLGGASEAPYKAWLPILVEQSKSKTARRRVYDWSIFTEAKGLASGAINDMELATDGQLWLLPGPSYRYDPATRRWARQAVSAISRISPEGSIQVEPVPASLGAGELFDLLFTPDGETWIASENGLLRRDRAARWQFFEPPAEWNLGLDGRTAIARTAGGGILYPTCGGIALLSAEERWTLVETPERTQLCGVKKIVADGQGSLWFSRESEADALYGLTTGGTWLRYQAEIGPGTKSFTDIAFAPNGGSWVSSWDGVYHRKPDGSWQHFDEENSPLYGIQSLAVDPAGNVWFGSSEMGTLHVRWQDGSWQSWGDVEGSDPMAGPPTSWDWLSPARLTPGRDGEIWMADDNNAGAVRLRHLEEIFDSRWP